jgi:hypothetical protein
MAKNINKTNTDVILEKVPPLIGISFLILPLLISLINPEIAAVLIILLNVYFLYKSFSFAVLFAVSLAKIRREESVEWRRRLDGILNVDEAMRNIQTSIEGIRKMDYASYLKEEQNPKLRFGRLSFLFHKYETIRFLNIEKGELNRVKNNIKDWRDIQHVVIVPHVKEPESILRATMEHLKNQTFPVKQINVVLAAEAADPNGVAVSEKLRDEYKDVFNNIWITNHVLQEGEAVGKSANMAWAGKEVTQHVNELGWDKKRVTITSCDADSKLPDEYYSYQTYLFSTIADSEYKYFNGALVLYNNIWRLPFYARVKNSMSSIYNVGRLIRTDKLVPFSTYTTTLWLIEEIGYWTPWVTPEDFHMFFKGLFKYPAKVQTIPMFIKIMSDAAEGESHWETIRNNYLQERRWQWGISDDGWVLKNLLTTPISKLRPRMIYMSIHTIFDHIFGPVGSLMILVGGNIPALIRPEFGFTVFGANLPRVSSSIIQLTIFCMIPVVILDIFLKPNTNNNVINRIKHLFEWIAQPFVGFILTVLPGLEAHTRLIFGKYLEYYVTKKKGE